MKFFIKEGSFPHLLLTGKAGSGKSTIVKILTSAVPCVVLNLNASSKDRGVATIKEKVPDFARGSTVGNVLKVVVLEEASGMTPDAQEALKDTMEKYSSRCRFILTANRIAKVIPEIQSRCVALDFAQFPRKDVKKLMQNILIGEGIEYTKGDVHDLVDSYYPDIRSCVNYLQLGSISGTFSMDDVNPNTVDTGQFLEDIMSGNLFDVRKAFTKARDFDWMYELLFTEFLAMADTNEAKSELVMTLAEYMNTSATSIDPEITATACIVQVMQDIGVKPKW